MSKSYTDILSAIFGSGTIDSSLGGFNAQVQAQFDYEVSTAVEDGELTREQADDLIQQCNKEYPVHKTALPKAAS